MNTSFLSRPPFNLDARAVAWVDTSFSALSLQDKVGQLFNLLSRGIEPDELERLQRLRPIGQPRPVNRAPRPTKSQIRRASLSTSATPAVVRFPDFTEPLHGTSASQRSLR
jgi:beta-N-acetylhexosaminidase